MAFCSSLLLFLESGASPNLKCRVREAEQAVEPGVGRAEDGRTLCISVFTLFGTSVCACECLRVCVFVVTTTMAHVSP